MKDSYSYEEQYLKQMVARIKHYYNTIIEHKETQTKQMIDARTEMNENYSNVIDYEDGDIMEFMTELPNIRMKEMQFTKTSQVLEFLESLIKKPYFGKLVVDKEPLYIGNMTFRDDDHNILIYDWRTPVAGLFYENKMGELSYRIPSGEKITADVTARRQFIIENSKLVSMFDSEMYIGDEVLQHLLTDTSQTKLKNIVATIQAEQNVIIRQPLKQDTLVYGPPGSGKTSLAMQRIAYLLYHHRAGLSADRILLLNPNEVFNDYLSDVLPELGEENVESSTFFTLRRKHPYFKGRQFETLTSNIRRLEAHDHTSYKYKNSIQYMNRLKQHLNNLDHKHMYFRTLTTDDGTFMSKEKLQEAFYSYSDTMTMRARIHDIRRRLLKKYHQDVANLEQKLYEEMLASNTYLGEDHELRQDAQKRAISHYRKVYIMIRRMRFIHIENIYINSLEIKSVRAETIASIRSNNYKYEDLAPMLIILMHLTDFSDKHFKHVLVDEVQDYSNLQYLALQTYYSRATFTSLGDKNQRLHPVQIDSLAADTHVLKRLVQSYRSTNQINEYLNTLIEDSIQSVSVDGEPVSHVTYTDLTESIKEIIKDNDNQIAIITPSREASSQIYDEIHEAFPSFKHLQDEDTIHNRTHLILPYYLAKGFEFNTVIVVDSDAYLNRLNVHYVLASRATRHLDLLNQDR